LQLGEVLRDGAVEGVVRQAEEHELVAPCVL
jgi:hypothetical protein